MNRRLEDLCIDIKIGVRKSIKGYKKRPLGVRVVPLLSNSKILNGHGLNYNEFNRWVDYELYEDVKYKRNPELGDIILCVSGAVGKVNIVRVPTDFLISGNYVIIKVDKNRINPFSLFYFLSSEEGQELLKTITINNYRILINELKNLEIPSEVK